MGSGSSRVSAASTDSAASTSRPALPLRRFKSKSYAGLAAAITTHDPRRRRQSATSVFTLEALAHMNLVAGTDFDLDDFRHVSEWCPTRPSPIIARAEAEQHELQPRKGVSLFLPKARRREETPAVDDTMTLLRKLVHITALANVAMVKFQETEATGLREKYGRKLVPISLIELLRGPRSPKDWAEIDDLLASAPSPDEAERRLCALALSLQTLSETIQLPAGAVPWI
jgi:hypothetical protein